MEGIKFITDVACKDGIFKVELSDLSLTKTIATTIRINLIEIVSYLPSKISHIIMHFRKNICHTKLTPN